MNLRLYPTAPPLEPTGRLSLREQVNRRAQELARLAGLDPPQVSQACYERAKREVTGEADPSRQSACIQANETGQLTRPANS